MNPDRIPIRLAGDPGIRYANEALSFGVPFAEGAFPAGTALRAFTADGRELPLQTAVMTTWKKDLRDVKWLLVDLQADPERDGETVWLEKAGDPSDRTDPSDQIAVSAAEGLITIDTGALRLTLRTAFELWRHRACDSPIAGCEIKTADGWRETLHGAGLLLYMKDQHGNCYTSISACPPPKVIIEEQGPLRVCVLITGHLTSAQGVRFCPYRLRIHLYAGKTDLRLFHTFVFDQDPSRIELTAIGLKVLAQPGDGALAAIGGDGPQDTSSPYLISLSASDEDEVERLSREIKSAAAGSATANVLSLLQSDDRHYTVTLDGTPAGAGEKAPGWASLSGADAGVVAAVRDFWQEYPKGFKIERDALDIGIWPDDAVKPLSFLTPFREPPIDFGGTRDEAEILRRLAERPTAPLAMKSFGARTLDDVRWIEETIERLAPDRVKSYCDFLGGGCDTGIGAAKTTEIVLRFTQGSPAREPAAAVHNAATAVAAAVQEPLAGIVDPGYLCGTHVVGPFLPAGHPRFADLDRYMTDLIEKIVIDPLDRCRRYGMMEHGHLVNAHAFSGGPPATDLVYHLYKETAPEKALRYIGPFNNEACDMLMGVWCQFLRTGQRRYLRQAQLATRATADVSFVHSSPGHEERVGQIHYHGAHAWSNPTNRSHSEVGGILLDYYLTGNRRLLEVALEVADGFVDDKLKPCGIMSCFSRLHREYTGPLSVMMEVYQATWHEKYGTPAKRSLNWLLRTVRTPGWMPTSVFTRGPRGDEAVVEAEMPPDANAATNVYHVLNPALRLFPSQPLTEFVLARAECGVGLDAAYGLTGNREYAVRALEALMRHKAAIAADEILGFYEYMECESLPRLMKTVVLAEAADPEGFRSYADRWREQHANQPVKDGAPDRPDNGLPDAHLGMLSTDPFPE